jgi:hypothetical protein
VIQNIHKKEAPVLDCLSPVEHANTYRQKTCTKKQRNGKTKYRATETTEGRTIVKKFGDSLQISSQ